ncbi:MAG: diguanylate cyclase, partial [Armatimonadota bacterium]|nr:diguanylate cyclase [Armatimonadota bacterium]
VGKPLGTELAPDIGEALHLACRRAITECGPLQIEYLDTPSARWLDIRLYPTADSGLSVFLQDITERKRAESRTRDQERLLAEAQQIARLGSWELTFPEGGARVSSELLRIIGWDSEELVGTLDSALAFIHPEDAGRVGREIVQARARGGSFEIEARILRPDGEARTMHSLGRVVRDSAGGQRLVAIAQDVTEEQAARRLAEVEEARRRAEIDYQAIFQYSTVGIFQATLEGRFLRVNPALARIGGYESPEAQTEALTNLGNQLYVHPERHEELKRLLRETGRVTGFESQVYRKDGSVIWISERARAVRNDAGEFLYYECFVEDITERKQQDEAQEHALHDALARADHDPLTGLLNHRAFYKRLEAETARAAREGESLAVAVLDLDNFKFFNDVYGHAVGDEVLKTVAGRLTALCRPYDVVARFGGDEFALLLCGIEAGDRRDIEARLRTGTAGLRFTPPNGEAAVPLSVSVGVAVFPLHSAERLEVVRIADERLRRAKTGAETDGEAARLRTGLIQSIEGFSLLDALVTAVDNKDRYTRRHSEDVMTHCLAMARALGLSQAEQDTLAVAALLHDVGKIGVPDAILRKPGRLTTEEFAAIKQHPQMGAIIVAAVPGMEPTLDAIRHHHERWDGDGYPDGLRGEAIPAHARLMAVADAFSAMTTDRPYRQSLGCAHALSVLQAGVGTQWDAAYVDALQRVLSAPTGRR